MTFYFRISFILFLLLILTTNRICAQNLVLNSSFEDTLPCPSIILPDSYIRPEHWFKPTAGSSDFFCLDTACAWGGGVPQNVFGWQNPRTGDSYCGFSIFNDSPFQNYREYISGTLSDTLIAGNEYCVSFWVSAANNCKYQTDDIAVYFSSDTSSFTDYTMNNVLNLNPQVENTSGNILADTLNWIQISGDFIAQGGEKFLTIGNFKNGTNTTLTILPGAVYNFGYYYIDDVSVIDCTVGLDENVFDLSDLNIFPNPAFETLTLSFKSLKFINTKFEIYNTLGKLIKDGYIFKNIITINISEFEHGIYNIRFSNQNGIFVKRFVKL